MVSGTILEYSSQDSGPEFAEVCSAGAGTVWDMAQVYLYFSELSERQFIA